eukprot:jgi/Tetstr1/460544/TSEL_005802.t1
MHRCPLYKTRLPAASLIADDTGCRRVARGTDAGQPELNSRRAVLGVAASAAVGNVLKADDAQALGFKKDLKPPRLRKIPDSEFKELPSGIKYYDVKVGDGLVAQQGSRVAIRLRLQMVRM